MEGFNLAELQAEFDQEDDESITQALRMAAESALAHTSGGGAGRRIRTASPVGATSSRSAGAAGAAAAAGDGGWGGSVVAAPPQGGRGGGGGGVSTAFPAEDELDALRRLEAEGGGVEFGNPAAWGGRPDPVGGGGSGGGGGARVGDDGDWTALSAKAVGRKRVADLKEYLDEEGVDYPEKAKKAQLVDMVLDLLAEG